MKMPGKTMLRIKTFHHVSLPVTDLEKSKKFYEEILGLKEIKRPPFDFSGAWYQLGDCQLHLIVHNHATFRKNKQIDSRDFHFAIRVASYREARDDLRAKGFHPEATDEFKKMKENPNATAEFPQLFIMDPDRNIIELNASMKKQLANELFR